jgi:hypothetical protein
MAKRLSCGPRRHCCGESIVAESATHRVARGFFRLEPTPGKTCQDPEQHLFLVTCWFHSANKVWKDDTIAPLGAVY